MLSVIGIHVFLPIQQAHDVIYIVLFILWAIGYQGSVAIDRPVGDVFKYRADGAVPLGLVGEIRAWGVKYAGRRIPASTQLQPEGPGEFG